MYELLSIYRWSNDCFRMYYSVRTDRKGEGESLVSEEKMFKYFLEGVAMMVTLYEICRTGKANKTIRKK